MRRCGIRCCACRCPPSNEAVMSPVCVCVCAGVGVVKPVPGVRRGRYPRGRPFRRHRSGATSVVGHPAGGGARPEPSKPVVEGRQGAGRKPVVAASSSRGQGVQVWCVRAGHAPPEVPKSCGPHAVMPGKAMPGRHPSRPLCHKRKGGPVAAPAQSRRPQPASLPLVPGHESRPSPPPHIITARVLTSPCDATGGALSSHARTRVRSQAPSHRAASSPASTPQARVAAAAAARLDARRV